RPAAEARAGGAGVLHHRADRARGLPRRRIPAGVRLAGVSQVASARLRERSRIRTAGAKMGAPSTGGTMSTRPGPDSWNDTGLLGEPDEGPVNLVQESEDSEPRDRGEDYQPLTARPDRDGQ